MKLENKKILTVDQACEYTGYAKSYLYKLTSGRILPFSKPNGKKIFFDKDLLDNWMLGGGKLITQNMEVPAHG